MYEGCLIRFRPIMMTTMAALLARCRSRWVTAPAAKRGNRWAWLWWDVCSSRS